MHRVLHKTQIGMSFAVFLSTALLVSACISGGIPSRLGLSSELPAHAPGLFFCALATLSWLTGMVLLVRISRSLVDSLASFLTVGVLILLLGFLGVEGTLSAIIHRAGWLTAKSAIPEILGALLVAGAAAFLLPRLSVLAESPEAERNRFLSAIEHSLDDFYIFDGVADDQGELVNFRFSYVNPNVERRLRVHRNQLLGRLLTEVRPMVTSNDLLNDYMQVVRTGEPFNREFFFDDELIRATWIHVHAVKLGNGLAVTSRDVTDNKRRADHVAYLAHYDQLTGLPNRTMLEDRLAQEIARANRQRHKIAVFLVDIDQFKEVNDNFGHACGDDLLTAVGKRLRSCVRESDTVARLGGDEFVILMPDFKSVDDLKSSGENLVRQVAQPMVIDDRETSITISVGISLYPDSGTDARQLLKKADSAMYIVKGTGRNGLNLYTHPQDHNRAATTENQAG